VLYIKGVMSAVGHTMAYHTAVKCNQCIASMQTGLQPNLQHADFLYRQQATAGGASWHVALRTGSTGRAPGGQAEVGRTPILVSYVSVVLQIHKLVMCKGCLQATIIDMVVHFATGLHRRTIIPQYQATLGHGCSLVKQLSAQSRYTT
jgi:hypothetical protein